MSVSPAGHGVDRSADRSTNRSTDRSTDHGRLLLQALDAARDVRICGKSLVRDQATRQAEAGAHDPTATYYFVLERLFPLLDLDEDSHLLDVGCAAGRTLAYFLDEGLPGHITGVELDFALAATCQEWSSPYPNLHVKAGSVLDLDLRPYTHLYLFNPFDSHVLQRLLDKIDAQVDHPLTVLHASDNGETYFYFGRPGWTLRTEGFIHQHQGVPVYGCPQHYSLWRKA